MIIYVGNMLSRHGKSPALMELIVPRLRENYDIRAYSDKEGQFSRMVDMVKGVYLNRKKAEIAIIDAFSTKAFWFAYIVSIICRLYKIPYITVLRGGAFSKRLEQSPSFCDALFLNASANVSPSIF